MAEMEYDEMEAVKFIRAKVEGLDNYDDDDILLVIDTMFEYFEKFDESDDFEEEVGKIATYVSKQICKDKGNNIKKEHVEPIVEAELEYENNLDC